MKITLYQKAREADLSEFQATTNEKLAWLLHFIAEVEEDKDAAKFRLNTLLSGKMINTDMHSFIIKINEDE